MRSVRAACGLAVMALLLAGCGGGGGGGSQSAMSSGSAVGTSGSSAVPATGDAKLVWTAPTTNSNGTALTDLAGYYIHYGTNSANLTNVINISSASAASYTVTGLTSGTWYFAISAYTNSGLQSALSNVGSKTIS